MNSKIKTIIGVVLLVAFVGLIMGVSKKAPSKKSAAKRPAVHRTQQAKQTPEAIKKRNEALRYISEAHRLASKKDFNGAATACNKAMQIAPDEPIVKNCQKRIEMMSKRG